MKGMLCACALLLGAAPAFSYDFLGTVSGENDGDQYGSAFCTVDFNNDGFPDLAVGASAADPAGLSSGKVYIYYGGPSADLIPDKILIGAASSFFGKSLASAGDFNGDGAEDLLVGAPFYDLPASSAGAAYLFYGGANPDTTVDHIFTGEAAGHYFGTAVAGIGDFNNDGYDDIAVGAYRADWGSFTDAGKVYIYYGGPSPNFIVDRVLVGSANGERFGYAITAGDFNGDTRQDVVVGAYSFDGALINQGRLYAYYGGTNPDTVIDLSITGPMDGNKFGWSLSAGRINVDAYDDIVMGTDGFSVDTFATGKVYVFFGGPSFDATPDAEYSLNRSKNDFLGFSVGSQVDLNGDGNADIISGMPGNADGAPGGGGAVVLHGGNALAVDTTILGSTSGEQLGHASVLWRGYGGSNAFVVAAGSQAFDNYRGRAYFYRVSGSGANVSPVITVPGTQVVIVGATVSFGVSATDANGTTPTLALINPPDPNTFIDNGNGTGTFSWNTAPQDIGTYVLLFVASDGQLADTGFVQVTVTDPATCCVGARGNVDLDPLDVVDIADLTALIAHLFISFEPVGCPAEANIDGDLLGVVDIADLTVLISHLFISFDPLGPCQ